MSEPTHIEGVYVEDDVAMRLRQRATTARMAGTVYYSLPSMVQAPLSGLAGELEEAADEIESLRERLAAKIDSCRRWHDV